MRQKSCLKRLMRDGRGEEKASLSRSIHVGSQAGLPPHLALRYWHYKSNNVTNYIACASAAV